MSLSLSQSETDVRVLVRRVSDTVRLTQTILRGYLHDAVRVIRTRLSAPENAPGYGVFLSPNTTVLNDAYPTGRKIALSHASYTFERLLRIDRLWDTEWREIHREDEGHINRHIAAPYTFRLEDGVAKIGPDLKDVSGTYRFAFYITHATITTGDWVIPVSLEQMLKFATAELVCISDRNWADAEKFAKKSEDIWKAALPALRQQYGLHPQQSGFRRIMGY